MKTFINVFRFISMPFDVLVIFVLLLGMLFEIDYIFYEFLRYIVFTEALITITFALAMYIVCNRLHSNDKHTYWAEYRDAKDYLYVAIPACIVIAILFNPISPIHLTRFAWGWVDLITIIGIGASMVVKWEFNID